MKIREEEERVEQCQLAFLPVIFTGLDAVVVQYQPGHRHLSLGRPEQRQCTLKRPHNLFVLSCH